MAILDLFLCMLITGFVLISTSLVAFSISSSESAIAISYYGALALLGWTAWIIYMRDALK